LAFPAIESQQFGTRHCRSIPPLQEVLKDSALYIDPFNPKTLLEAPKTSS